MAGSRILFTSSPSIKFKVVPWGLLTVTIKPPKLQDNGFTQNKNRLYIIILLFYRVKIIIAIIIVSNYVKKERKKALEYIKLK